MDYIGEAAQYGLTIMDRVADLLTDLKSHVPQRFQNINAKIQDTLDSLQTVKGQINAQFAKIGDELGLKIGEMLDEGVENSVRGSSRKTLTKRQLASPPVEEEIFDNIKVGQNSTDFLTSIIPNIKEGALSKKRSHRDFSSLTDDEAIALYAYTTDCYEFINPLMRGIEGANPQWQPVGDTIDAALGKLSDNEARVFKGTVYRGVDLGDEIIIPYVEKGEFTDRAFVSSSKNPRKAFTERVKMKIESKKGIKIEEMSYYGPNEEEVLFRANSKFKILSSEHDERGFWNLHLEEI